MKKILGLTIAALLVLGLVGGGTWAFFSDQETSTGNTITAGTLNLTEDLDRELVANPNNVNGAVSADPALADGANVSVQFSNIAPSDAGSFTWTLANTGNLKAYLTITSTVTSITNGTNEPENAAITANGSVDANLDTLLGVRLTRKVGAGAETNVIGDATNYVPLSGLEAALDGEVDKAFDEDTGANDTYIYKLYWSLAEDVKKAGDDVKFGTGDDVDIDDNIVQSDKVTIDITFALNQVI